MLLESRKETLKWLCRLCDPQILEILTNFEKVKKFPSEIKTIRQEIDHKIQDLEGRIGYLHKKLGFSFGLMNQ